MVYRRVSLTADQLSEYYVNGGMLCVVCGSIAIRIVKDPTWVDLSPDGLGSGEVVVSQVEHVITCNACSSKWVDVYTLTSVKDVEVLTSPAIDFVLDDK